MKAVYPVLFTQIEDRVLVEVPDLDIVTEGKDLVDAVGMARDSIEIIVATLEDDHKGVPAASDLDNISINEGSFAELGHTIKSLVDIDSDRYRENIAGTGITEGVNQ